jgi:hypothetical protein
MIDRRTFLKLSAPAVMTIPIVGRAQTLMERGRFDDEQLILARAQLLEMVNSERTEAGLKRVQLDDLACRVATEHARDMAQKIFLSHWGSDGRKSYQRYALAGGTDAIQENVASAENIESVSPNRVLADLRDMHLRMLYEVPPDDGHRKTILYRYHTHLGFGIALQDRSLRLVELYLGRHLRFDPLTIPNHKGSAYVFKGQVLSGDYFLSNVSVCHEPPPRPPEIDWLRIARSVSYPDAYRELHPKAPSGMFYMDGSTGDFEWNSKGQFRVEIKLGKREPGIYTIIFWIAPARGKRAFTAAQVCLTVEDETSVGKKG